MTAPRSQGSRTVRILLATIAALLGVIAALVGGILQRLDGSSLPQSFQYGCGAFGATVLLFFALFYFLNGNGPGDRAAAPGSYWAGRWPGRSKWAAVACTMLCTAISFRPAGTHLSRGREHGR